MRDDRTYQTEPYMPQNPDSNVGDEYIVKRNPNLIEIPDNATNGDVIKALFHVKDVEEMECCIFASIAGDADMRVYKDWWNAPYEAENE